MWLKIQTDSTMLTLSKKWKNKFISIELLFKRWIVDSGYLLSADQIVIPLGVTLQFAVFLYVFALLALSIHVLLVLLELGAEIFRKLARKQFRN